MIPGGYILLARKTLESDIMNKPALYFKLWSWMLLQAKFRSSNKLERGQFITSINEMREAMSYKIGYRKEKPTIKQIRGVYESLMKGSMIGTMKVTGGLLITICNYEEYQNPKNYEGHNEGVHEGKVEGTSYIRKKEKKERMGIYNKNLPIPEKYQIQKEHIEYAKSKGLDENQAKDQFEVFKIHHQAKGTKFKNWYAAYQKWIRNSIEFGKVDINNKTRKIKTLEEREKEEQEIFKYG